MTTINLQQLIDMHVAVERLFVYFDSFPKPMPNDVFQVKLDMIDTRVVLKMAVARATMGQQVEVTA